MKAILKRNCAKGCSAKRSVRGRSSVLKGAAKSKGKKCKVLCSDWHRLNKADADFIVRMVSVEPRPNPALEAVRELHASIPQLG